MVSLGPNGSRDQGIGVKPLFLSHCYRWCRYYARLPYADAYFWLLPLRQPVPKAHGAKRARFPSTAIHACVSKRTGILTVATAVSATIVPGCGSVLASASSGRQAILLNWVSVAAPAMTTTSSRVISRSGTLTITRPEPPTSIWTSGMCRVNGKTYRSG